MSGSWRPIISRWLKFNAVGGIGIVVQLSSLAALKSGLHLNYLWATALAVEIAVLHNFVWHERFTWAERSGSSGWGRLVKFNLTTGTLSILGNLAAMQVLVGWWGVPYLVSNGVTIAACSILTFLVSDRFVFAGSANTSVACRE